MTGLLTRHQLFLCWLNFCFYSYGNRLLYFASALDKQVLISWISFLLTVFSRLFWKQLPPEVTTVDNWSLFFVCLLLWSRVEFHFKAKSSFVERVGVASTILFVIITMFVQLFWFGNAADNEMCFKSNTLETNESEFSFKMVLALFSLLFLTHHAVRYWVDCFLFVCYFFKLCHLFYSVTLILLDLNAECWSSLCL